VVLGNVIVRLMLIVDHDQIALADLALKIKLPLKGC
jgi:hypothetical protein